MKSGRSRGRRHCSAWDDLAHGSGVVVPQRVKISRATVCNAIRRAQTTWYFPHHDRHASQPKLLELKGADWVHTDVP
jgi:hypothetical protein